MVKVGSLFGTVERNILSFPRFYAYEFDEKAFAISIRECGSLPRQLIPPEPVTEEIDLESIVEDSESEMDAELDGLEEDAEAISVLPEQEESSPVEAISPSQGMEEEDTLKDTPVSADIADSETPVSRSLVIVCSGFNPLKAPFPQLTSPRMESLWSWTRLS